MSISQGPLSPGTMANDHSNGGLRSWSNPDNAKVSDGVYTTAGGNTTGSTDYLKATNFGFSIPTGATINGILVEIERVAFSTGVVVKDSEVKIVKSSGTIGTTNKADTVTNWPYPTEAYVSYGSSSDLWGETWAYSDINNANFGMVISARIAVSTASVDHIRITVYYTVPPISGFFF